MAVEINIKKISDPEKYPYLGQRLSTKSVLLMTKTDEGIVLIPSSKSKDYIGKVLIISPNDVVPYNDEIVIKNK